MNACIGRAIVNQRISNQCSERVKQISAWRDCSQDGSSEFWPADSQIPFGEPDLHSDPRRRSSRFEFPVGWNRGTVTHMNDTVMVFPIRPGQRFSFLADGQMHFFIIPAPVRRKPKPAEVIPISTTVSDGLGRVV